MSAAAVCAFVVWSVSISSGGGLPVETFETSKQCRDYAEERRTDHQRKYKEGEPKYLYLCLPAGTRP